VARPPRKAAVSSIAMLHTERDRVSRAYRRFRSAGIAPRAAKDRIVLVHMTAAVTGRLLGQELDRARGVVG
jgi:hypothetical protein